MPSVYYINSLNLDTFISRLQKDFAVFAPFPKDSQSTNTQDYSYRRLSNDERVTFNPYRSVEPLKAFFTHPSEKVCDYFNAQPLGPAEKQVVILGVKSCDLAAHRIQDYVFLEGVEVDSLYSVRRENTFLISGDCTLFKPVCFCLSLDILPHPTSGFDLNLSPLNDGYLAEVGSAKGAYLVGLYEGLFSSAKETQISARQSKREQFIERLKKHLLPQDIPAKAEFQKLVREGYHAETWQQFMLTCVECGGCNLICDTCHCFLLADSSESAGFQKVRKWDSCLYANYARVAGGANPLRLRAQRLRNRFMKKFDFFPDNLGVPACCGCGRCIEVCPGKIDIREVLKDLAVKAKTQK